MSTYLLEKTVEKCRQPRPNVRVGIANGIVHVDVTETGIGAIISVTATETRTGTADRNISNATTVSSDNIFSKRDLIFLMKDKHGDSKFSGDIASTRLRFVFAMPPHRFRSLVYPFIRLFVLS